MDTERYIMLGKYAESLSRLKAAKAGRLINAALRFLDSGVEISAKGRKEFVKSNPEFCYGERLSDLDEFLYFAKVRVGRVRKPNVEALEKKAELSKRNQEKVAQFLIWLSGRMDYSEKTLYMYKTGITQYFQYADEFNQDLARRYVATLESKGLSPKTVNIRITALKVFAEFMKKPIDIKKYKIARTLHVENVPTEREYQRLLEWGKANDPDRLYWLVRLLGSTGMRLSEFQKIRWKHVIEGEAYLKCKGSKYRSIYFPKAVISEAKEYVKTAGIDVGAYLLKNRFGEQMSDRGIGGFLKRAAEKAEYPKEKAHCHAFRHFFAKMYLKKSGDVVQLAELLGHGSIDTTRIYLQKSKKEHIKDVNKNVTW